MADSWTPAEMHAKALGQIRVHGADPARLIAVADAYIEKWAALAAADTAGEDLDGRASIYTNETYAEARDRWATYRALLAADYPQEATA